MSKAVFLIKSPNAETYRVAFLELRTLQGDLTEVVWIFYNCERVDKIIPIDLITEKMQSTVAVTTSASAISRHLNGAESVDVTGLPKEEFAQVLPLVVGFRSLRAYTLTRSERGSQYLDLLSEPTMDAFRKGYISKLLFFKLTIVVMAAALVGLAITQVASAIPSAQAWATWLGVFLGIVGAFLSYISIRRG